LKEKNYSISQQIIDEVLESIWVCKEQERSTISNIIKEAHAKVNCEVIEEMAQQGLVKLQENTVEFTKQGERIASSIIRRHRLAERLLVDVLGLTMEQAERVACTYEHTIVPEVTDGICTLLGHPKECPHKRVIPPGKYCREGRTEVKRALMPLNEVVCGMSVRFAYIRTDVHDRIEQLLSMGISPGVMLHVHQRSPVFVIQVDESEFALDNDVAKDIYVWVTPE
jgi:DtxR family Mn-dependent transcriptional regulator